MHACLLVFLVLALLTTPAWSTTYHVTTSGNDSNSCSAATNSTTAKRTIRNAVNNCARSAGDVLYIHAGTYAEALNGDSGTSWPSGSSWSTPITFAGFPGDTVIIRAGASGGSTYAMIQLESSQYLIFDNLILDAANFSENSSNKCLKIGGGDHIRWQNSVFRNARGFDSGQNASSGILDTSNGFNEYLNIESTGNAGYGFYLSAPNVLIDRSRFHHNDRYGIHIWHDDGGRDNITISNTKMYSNGDNATLTFGGRWQPGLLLAQGTNNRAFNNLIYDNFGGGIQLGGSNCGVYNNTIVANANGDGGQSCMFGSCSGGTATNNICYGNGSNTISGITGSNNSTSGTDPQFVNYSGRDLHLTSGSPDGANGATLSSIFTTDHDGNARTVPWSRGAYIVGGGTPPPPPSNDPIAWWKFDEGAGTTAASTSATAHTGTLVGGTTWTAGRVGSFAVQFDGVNDAVTIPDSILTAFGADHTVCFWVQLASPTTIGPGGFRQTFVNLFLDSATGLRSTLIEDSTPASTWAVSISTGGGTTITRQTTATTFTANTWVHLCHTLASGVLTLYVNTVTASVMDPGPYSIGDSSALGARTPTTGNINGKLDQVKIWNRALSAADIQAEFGGTSVPPRHRVVVR